MAGQWGRKRESSWANPATVVDDFYPVLEASIVADPTWMRSAGIRSDRYAERPADLGTLKVTGSTSMEFLTTPAASILLDMFGAVTGSGPLTFTPGSPNESFASQAGIVDSSGTVRPATAYGCKLDGWTLRAAVGEYVKLTLPYTAKTVALHRSVADGVTTNASAAISSATAVFTIGDVGRPISGTGISSGTTILSVQSATAATLSANATASGTAITFTIGAALAAASYGAGVPWTFLQTTISAAGTSIASAKSVEITAAKNLRNDRNVLGTPFILEQQFAKYFNYSTSVEADYDSNAFSILQLSGGQASLVTTLSDAISGGTKSLVITQNVQVQGDLAKLSQPGLESQPLRFGAGATTDASTITAVLTNGETSAA